MFTLKEGKRQRQKFYEKRGEDMKPQEKNITTEGTEKCIAINLKGRTQRISFSLNIISVNSVV